jgi:endogenous inhibitor of DNA gyrase (YacG/DUF329 family)
MLTVKCPCCQQPAVYHASNPARPFCSPRCKAIDLGAWASDAFVVEGAAPTTQAELEALEAELSKRG